MKLKDRRCPHGNPPETRIQLDMIGCLEPDCWDRVYAGCGLARLPIPMVLHCPACQTQHVDAPDEAKGWTNPPHRSHLCHSCGWIWRPADVATTGVASIKTRGAADNGRAPAPERA